MRENTSMQESNVYSFEVMKRKRKLKILEKNFKNYLSSLRNESLQAESNYIINKTHEDGLTEEDLLKSALLMDELAKRMGKNNFSEKVSYFSKYIRENNFAE